MGSLLNQGELSANTLETFLLPFKRMNHTSLGVVTDFLCEGFSQASQSENVSIWTRKTNEKHDPPTWDESKSLLPAPVDTQEPGCRGQQ